MSEILATSCRKFLFSTDNKYLMKWGKKQWVLIYPSCVEYSEILNWQENWGRDLKAREGVYRGKIEGIVGHYD